MELTPIVHFHRQPVLQSDEQTIPKCVVLFKYLAVFQVQVLHVAILQGATETDMIPPLRSCAMLCDVRLSVSSHK
jgi:hypothetical protein